jgi:hypothetical protein
MPLISILRHAACQPFHNNGCGLLPVKLNSSTLQLPVCHFYARSQNSENRLTISLVISSVASPVRMEKLGFSWTYFHEI